MMNHAGTRNSNIWYLALNVIGLGLSLAVLLGLSAASWPTQYGAAAADLILRGRPFFPQEYDTLIFRIIVITVVVLTLSAYLLFKRHLNSETFGALLQRALAGQVVGLLIMGAVIYWMIIYPTFNGLVVALRVMIVLELLYLLTLRWHESWFTYVAGQLKGRWGAVRILSHCCVGAFVLAVVWANPKTVAAIARANGLSVDIGAVVGAQAVAVVYLFCIYVLLWRVVPSVALSFIGVCWAMKWLLFHPGINASYYFSPVLINVAYGLGVLFFLLLRQDRHRGGSCWLVLALMVLIMSYKIYLPSGIFLSVSLLMYFFFQNSRQWQWPLITLISSVAAYLILSFNPWVAFEGFPAVPFYYVLRERLFYIYAGSVLLLTFYLIVLLWAFRQVFHEHKNNLAWQGALACYGLLLICNYMRLSTPIYFYPALWPLLVLLLPIVNGRLARLKLRTLIIAVIGLISIAFIFGNPWFLWSVQFKGLGAG